jgi:hypothetical protein
MSKLLTNIRAQLSSVGQSELEIIESLPSLQGMWDQMQELRAEMYAAKKKAADEAAAPYLDTINEIEQKYALLVHLKRRNA